MNENTTRVYDDSDDVTTSLDIFAAVLDIGGIVGNTIAFIALLRCARSASMYIILRCLAVGDTIFLFCHLLFQLASYYKLIELDRLAKCIGYTYVANVASTVTVWTTVLLSTERLVAVYYPFKHKEIFSKKRTIIWVLVVWLGSFVCRLPGFYQRLVQILPKADGHHAVQVPTNSSISAIDQSHPTRAADTASATFLKNLHLVLWSFEAIASIAVVFVCNIMILVTICKHVKQWASVRTKHRQEMLATRLPLWVIAMFLLSEVPKKICGLLLILGAVTPSNLQILITVCDICTVLNSSTNIIVYFVCSRSIRSRFVVSFISSISKANGGAAGGSFCCGLLLDELPAPNNTTSNGVVCVRKKFSATCNDSVVFSLVCENETLQPCTTRL